jgi:hypothetical protein
MTALELPSALTLVLDGYRIVEVDAGGVLGAFLPICVAFIDIIVVDFSEVDGGPTGSRRCRLFCTFLCTLSGLLKNNAELGIGLTSISHLLDAGWSRPHQ